jgi:hypothetical protein
MEMERRRGEEPEVLRRARDVERARQGQRLPGVDALGPGQVLQAGLDPIGDRQEQARALLGRHAGPGREGPARRLDRPLDIAFVAVGDRRIRRPGGRLEVVEIPAGGRLDQFTVDVIGDHRQAILPPSTGRLIPVM